MSCQAYALAMTCSWKNTLQNGLLMSVITWSMAVPGRRSNKRTIHHAMDYTNEYTICWQVF